MQFKKNPFRTMFGYLLMFIVCSGLILLTTQNAIAEPDPSPAGGGYLTLEDDKDFVSTIKPWFPDREFRQLTIEAWVYFDSLPSMNTYWCIFGQEGRFHFVLDNIFGDVVFCNLVHSFDSFCSCACGVSLIPSIEEWDGKWMHIFASYNPAVGGGIAGNSRNGLQGGFIKKSDKPFKIGGLVPQDPNWSCSFGENVVLRGYIDEVRVSDTIRYNSGNYSVPIKGLKLDAHTIGLWHFDGKNAFKDESGNGYILWKNETLAIQEQGKISITWGKIKNSD
ncbi:MAG: hypothetical protein QG588_2414 [Candidatus Poribacteria bacterium]|nr:hypothetical protein [Candidatus Poribacteria bacterium]